MNRFVVDLLQPFTLAVLLSVVFIVLLWRRPTARRWMFCLIACWIGLVLVSTEPIANLALGTLERHYPPETSLSADVQAIVVLGGGADEYDASGEHVGPSAASVMRCLHAGRIYRKYGPCPVVATGGKTSADRPGPSEAKIMRDVLVLLGVEPSDILLEEDSRTTYENALGSQPLLAERDLGRIVLVTDAAHMYRASGCFEALGLEATPAPCNHYATRIHWSPAALLPNSEAAEKSGTAFHEWLGIAWYWLQGRL